MNLLKITLCIICWNIVTFLKFRHIFVGTLHLFTDKFNNKTFVCVYFKCNFYWVNWDD